MRGILFLVSSLLLVIIFMQLVSAQDFGYNYLETIDGTFTGLTDTPSSYTGDGGKCVRVTVGEDGLEFGDCAELVGGTFNATYNIWAYNQTTESGDGSYNVTYAPWSYNQTQAANLSIVTDYGKWFYNMTINYGSYNSTYDGLIQWGYNMTSIGVQPYLFNTAGININLNETKLNATIDDKIKTNWYNITSILNVTGVSEGDISDLQQYNIVTYNLSEAVILPAIDFRVNFTGVENFNEIIIRYKSSSGENHNIVIQLYDYGIGDWESYATYSEIVDYNVMTLGVFDSSAHIENGVVQLRFYQGANGNPAHTHYFDWIVLADGPATFSTVESDPRSFHKNQSINNVGFNVTADIFNATNDVYIKDRTVYNWLYNQTYSGSTYNITYDSLNSTYGKFWYNMTTGEVSAGTYNETYASYNFTTQIAGVNTSDNLLSVIGGIYNSSYLTSVGDVSTYNETYHGLNISYNKFWYNMTIDLGSYNATYHIWSYNQTYIGGFYNISYDIGSYNSTYHDYSYNQTQAANNSIVLTYDEKWSVIYNITYNTYAYNMTAPAITYIDTQVLNINTSSNILELTGGIYNVSYSTYAYNQTAAVTTKTHLSNFTDDINATSNQLTNTASNVNFSSVGGGTDRSYIDFVNGGIQIVLKRR